MYSPRPGKILLALAFVLNAEKIDHVGGFEHLVELVNDAHAQLFKRARHQR